MRTTTGLGQEATTSTKRRPSRKASAKSPMTCVEGSAASHSMASVSPTSAELPTDRKRATPSPRRRASAKNMPPKAPLWLTMLTPPVIAGSCQK